MHFFDIPHSVVDELSNDQHYVYGIYMAALVGAVDAVVCEMPLPVQFSNLY